MQHQLSKSVKHNKKNSPKPCGTQLRILLSFSKDRQGLKKGGGLIFLVGRELHACSKMVTKDLNRL